MGERLKHPVWQFAVLLVVAAVLRCSTFGDPDLHADETFYFATGLAMHQGALPYVDVWDRKPFGLFLLYYLITAVSSSPLAYQLAATLSAAATAAVIARMAQRWTSTWGGLAAGIIYILMLGPLQGFGGQSPVFYNLFVALAALIVLDALPALHRGETPRRLFAAMALAGFAVTVKTTALFEAALLGLYAVAAFHRSGAGLSRTMRSAAGWALAGAAPALLFALFYAVNGHWREYAHAMFQGGLNAQSDWPTAKIRLSIMVVTLLPYLAIAAFALLRQEPRSRNFLLLWLAAAAIGLAAVPRFYLHYALPIAVPVSAAAAALLARRWIGPLALAVAAAASLHAYWPFDFGHTARSRAAMERLAHAIRAHDGGRGLLVYEGPILLYPMTGHRFLSPLASPPHLNHLIEKDASHLSTAGEIGRILAQRPGAIVNSVEIRNGPANPETRGPVLDYIAQRCRPVDRVRIYTALSSYDVDLFGDCAS